MDKCFCCVYDKGCLVTFCEKRQTYNRLSMQVKSVPFLVYIMNTVVVWGTRKHAGCLKCTDVVCASGFRRFSENQSDLICTRLCIRIYCKKNRVTFLLEYMPSVIGVISKKVEAWWL